MQNNILGEIRNSKTRTLFKGNSKNWLHTKTLQSELQFIVYLIIDIFVNRHFNYDI